MPEVEVPINIIRILHQQQGAAGDSVGAQNNLGCRMTDADIWQLLRPASNFYRKALSIGLTIDDGPTAPPQVILDQHADLLECGISYSTARSWRGFCEGRNDFIYTELYTARWVPGGMYRPERLNLFFTGHIAELDISGQPTSFVVYGGTLDPEDVWTGQGFRRETYNPVHEVQQPLDPYIFINDNARGNGTFHVVEHELGHWFLRHPPRYNEPGGQYPVNHEHFIQDPLPTPPVKRILMVNQAPAYLRLWDDPANGICESEEMYLQSLFWNCADNLGNLCCN